MLWLRRGAIAIVSLLLIVLLLGYFVVGTESGSRWVLNKVAAAVPMDIDTANVTGTLLTQLDIPALRYADAKLILDIDELAFNVDWSETSLDRVALEYLAARELRLQTTGEPESAPQPFTLTMPPLPLGVTAAEIHLSSGSINETIVTDIALTAIEIRDQTISLDNASAIVTPAALRAQDFVITLDGDVPLSGEIDWRLADSSWSGRATLSDTLRDLAIEHELNGNLRAATKGRVELLGRIQPIVDLATVSDLGNVDVRGSVAPDSIDLSVIATNIDPSRFLDGIEGNIDARFDVAASAATEFRVDVTSLSGTWNGHPATANGHLSRQGQRWECNQCQFDVGRNRLQADGRIDGTALDADIDIDAQALDELWNGLAGSLTADGSLGGVIALPVWSGEATGTSLEFGGWQLGSMQMHSRNSSTENVDLDIVVADLKRTDRVLGSGRVELSGQVDRLEFKLDWDNDVLGANAQAIVAVQGDVVSGEVTSANITEPVTGICVCRVRSIFRRSRERSRLVPLNG